MINFINTGDSITVIIDVNDFRENKMKQENCECPLYLQETIGTKGVAEVLKCTNCGAISYY